MDGLRDPLEAHLLRLGRAVAAASDQAAVESGASREALDRGRRGFVSGSGGQEALSGRRPRWVPALAAAACLAVMAGGAGLAFRTGVTRGAGPSGLSFSVGSVGEGAVPGVVGEWVAASADAPLPARFSDGSTLSLSPGARMRVTTTNPAGADVLIERGSVHAAVLHPGRDAARWAVRAGPFAVQVTGTTFDAAWDPIAETFDLTMIEGRVLVTGPGIPPGRAVVGGEHLVVSSRDGRMMLSSAGSAPPAAVVAPVTLEGPDAPDALDARRAAAAAPAAPASEHAPVPPPARPSASPAWRELSAKGKYRDAFAAAEAAGFGLEVDRASAAELLVLADAARFSGSPARAREALLAARRRFGVRGQSAFLLGKIAADQQGAPADAVSWFETYLSEEPGGALAEQALGRILDLTRGSPEAVQRAAARYLARYPDGSHAALARTLVANPGAP